ncbi:MAG TPA: hypothetical protein VE913_20540 [Longimicrobium sp.]|nr:hypothetical protein [Longimicrobium sp.]
MRRMGIVMLALALGACGDATGSDEPFTRPEPPAAGVGVPRGGILEQSKVFMKQVTLVNLDQGFARVPLFRGTAPNGTRVWFVLMDASDSTTAASAGLNFAPRMVNSDLTCPACIQTVTSSNPIPGRAPVQFAGSVDFAPQRILTPNPVGGFPPLVAQPGGVAMTGYSDLVRVRGSNIVFNAPIVATGNGPFDVTTHTNTHDRLLRIDTVGMTADFLIVRAFAGGKDIMYFTFSASSEVAATLERNTFVPVLGNIPFANDDENPLSARVALWAFVNGQTGRGLPTSQGLNHLIVDGANNLDASLQNTTLQQALQQGGDARNVLGTFPTFDDNRLRRLYTPMWDAFLTEWRSDLVESGRNFAQTDGNVIRQLAARGFLTNPGGRMLNSAGFVVNCPPFAFLADRPTGPVAPRPPGQP